jgi:hypothetical protein
MIFAHAIKERQAANRQQGLSLHVSSHAAALFLDCECFGMSAQYRGQDCSVAGGWEVLGATVRTRHGLVGAGGWSSRFVLQEGLSCPLLVVSAMTAQ